MRVLNFSIVRRAGISFLELDDGSAILSEEEIDTSTFRQEDTVYVKACLRMGYLQSGTKRRRIERKADDVAEVKQAATAGKEEDVILVAKKSATPADSLSSNTSAILSEAPKCDCQNCGCPAEEIAEVLETDAGFIDERMDLALSDPLYNVQRNSGHSGAGCDNLTTECVAAMARLRRQRMKSGTHGHVFCSIDEFSK